MNSLTHLLIYWSLRYGITKAKEPIISSQSTSQELQRRLDQTLGKPGSYLTGIDRVGNVRPMTVGARLYRVEQHMSNLDKKLDQIMHAINGVAHQKMISSSSSTQPLILPAAPSQAPSPIPLRCLEDDV